MIVRVKLFAAARELTGQSEVELKLSDGATVADVERALVMSNPELERVVRHARWAVDAEFAASNTMVFQESELALIPPVSGG
jgi:molybdopterin converting factor subunit 1